MKAPTKPDRDEALYSPRVVVDSNMSNSSDMNDTTEELIPFPCVAGSFNQPPPGVTWSLEDSDEVLLRCAGLRIQHCSARHAAVRVLGQLPDLCA